MPWASAGARIGHWRLRTSTRPFGELGCPTIPDNAKRHRIAGPPRLDDPLRDSGEGNSSSSRPVACGRSTPCGTAPGLVAGVARQFWNAKLGGS
jgi:hypothetical protein